MLISHIFMSIYKEILTRTAYRLGIKFIITVVKDNGHLISPILKKATRSGVDTEAININTRSISDPQVMDFGNSNIVQ